MTQLQARIEYVEPGHRDFVALGPQDRVTEWARRFAARPDATVVWKPEPEPGRPGWATVRVRLRDPAPAARVRNPPMRVTVQGVWPSDRRRPSTPQRLSRRELYGEVALYGGGLVVAGGLVWLLVAAVRGAASWAAAHVGPILLVLLVAVAVVMLWATSRSGGRAARHDGACQGLTFHCPKCRDNR